MKAAVPSMVRFVRQNGFSADCGVSALAMLAGVLYEDALVAAANLDDPSVLQTGLTWTEMRKVARRLGLQTRLLRAYDVEESTGVLGFKADPDGPKPKAESHYAFLWEGRVVDGNGEMWMDPDTFCKYHGYKRTWLMVSMAED